MRIYKVKLRQGNYKRVTFSVSIAEIILPELHPVFVNPVVLHEVEEASGGGKRSSLVIVVEISPAITIRQAVFTKGVECPEPLYASASVIKLSNPEDRSVGAVSLNK